MTVDAPGSFSWTNPSLPGDPEPSNRPKHSPLAVVIGLGVVMIAFWLVLTVVGGGGGGKLNPIAQAAERTSNVSGVRFAVSGTGTLPQSPMTVSLRGAGAIDFENDSGRMNLTGELPAPAGAVQFTYVFSGGTMYMASPQLSGLLPAGKQWISGKISAGDQTNAASDPHAILQRLEAVSSQIINLGKERIRGVATTHYQATATFNGTEVPVDVWVDRGGLLRRMQESASDAGSGATFAISLDLYGYGYKPQVSVPASDQVIDAADLKQSTVNQLSQ